MNNRIMNIIDELLPSITSLRHDLHTFPETAYQETGTRKRLLCWLEKEQVLAHLTVHHPLIGTDLTAELPGNMPGVIGLRADMDALPVEEKTGAPYRSKRPGVMHACGHDGHMAVLAGAAAVLSRIDPDERSAVRLIFQPGEEEVCAGAELVKAGVCRGLDKVYALHGWPGIPRHVISTKPGVLTAAANTFTIEFRGVSCHGAAPEAGNNPLIPAAELVMRLAQLHREVSQKHQAVVSCCSVQGGQGSNVIPGTAVVRGTTRYLDVGIGENIREEVRKAAEECGQKYGTAADIDYQCRYRIPVINNEGEAARVERTAINLFGPGGFQVMPRHSMVAEDFAFYLERVPGCMYLLGMGESHAGLHSQHFDFDDEVLRTGILMMVSLAMPQ